MWHRSAMDSAAKDSRATRNGPSHSVDSIAWALFFIWIGVAILAGVSWGWSLIGIGLIILGAELVRSTRRLPTSGFWIACGIVLLVGGLWVLFNLSWPLVPVLLILFGLVVLGKALAGGNPLSR